MKKKIRRILNYAVTAAIIVLYGYKILLETGPFTAILVVFGIIICVLNTSLQKESHELLTLHIKNDEIEERIYKKNEYAKYLLNKLMGGNDV